MAKLKQQEQHEKTGMCIVKLVYGENQFGQATGKRGNKDWKRTMQAQAWKERSCEEKARPPAPGKSAITGYGTVNKTPTKSAQ